MDYKSITQFEIKLEQLFPDLFFNIAEYQTVSGSLLEYTAPRITEERIDFPKTNKETSQLRVQISNFSINLDGNRDIAQVLKVELVQKRAERKKTATGYANVMISQYQTPSKKAQQANGLFQSASSKFNTSTMFGTAAQKMFRFVLNVYDHELIYNGESLDGEHYEIMEQLDASNQLDQSLQNMMASFNHGQTVFLQTTRRDQTANNLDVILEKREDANVKREWGEGIKIVRYMNGTF